MTPATVATIDVRAEAEAAWALLAYARECVILAELDATELDRAERALAQAVAHGERAGLLRTRGDR